MEYRLRRDDLYFLSITDCKSRKTWIRLLREHTTEIIAKELDTWMAEIERQTGKKLKKVRIDNTPEFRSLETVWGKPKGIVFEFIEPYRQAQNGVAERLNRLILEIVRCLLLDMRIPKRYWPWALQTVCYLKNRFFPVRDTSLTPEEIWTGQKANP
ncbi:hypothetical protein VTO42DRAFT_4455 [Malbranchea cinnamomea]